MDDITSIFQNEYLKEEQKRYAPESTGKLQKLIEEKIQEEFQKRSIEKDDEIDYLRYNLATHSLMIDELKYKLKAKKFL